MTSDERDRWLRAARPSTPADDGWVDTEDGATALRAIHDALPRAAAAARRRFWVQSGRLGLVTAVAAGVVTALVVANSGGKAGSPGDQSPSPKLATGPGALPAERTALVAYSNCAQLLADLRKHTARHVTAYGLPGGYSYYGDGPVFTRAADQAVLHAPVASSAGLKAAVDPEYSTTNNQESDVDEPDVVKTDGKRLISVSDGELRIVDASSRKLTGELDLNQYAGAAGAQLLVQGDRALVLMSSGYGYGYYSYGRGYGYGGDSSYVLVDMSGKPKVISTLHTKGSAVDARLADGTIRLVVGSRPNIRFPSLPGKHSAAERKAANKVVVEHAPISAWLPTYTVTDDTGSHDGVVPCTSVRHSDGFTGASMTSVYSVDLATGLRKLAPISLAADGAIVYSTTTSMYVTSNVSSEATQIHRFDISRPGQPDYLGTGSVPGHLLNSYSISDYDGHLRVVTTWNFHKSRHTVSAVQILDDETLKRVGHLGGLGHDENVYAVRFFGDRGYVVTYRQIDPLYVLDLSDPTDPREIGSLKTPGYSTYLHPIGDHQLLAVGAEVKRNEPAAVRLSLIDVSGPPKITDTIVRTGTYANGIDPHAFLYWAKTGEVVVPARKYRGSERTTAVVAKIDGDSLDTIGAIGNPATLDGDAAIARTLVIGGTLWTLSDTGLMARDLKTLKIQKFVEFS